MYYKKTLIANEMQTTKFPVQASYLVQPDHILDSNPQVFLAHPNVLPYGEKFS